MTYTILWHPKALKRLEKLPQNIVHRVLQKVDQLQENPFVFLESYEGKNYFKLRIGDYRALVDVNKTKNTIKIQIFDHRGRIYKRVK